MLDVDSLNDDVVSAILQNKDWPDNEEGYKKIALMSPQEAMDAYLTWIGIIGFTVQIVNAWSCIWRAERSRIVEVGGGVRVNVVDDGKGSIGYTLEYLSFDKWRETPRVLQFYNVPAKEG